MRLFDRISTAASVLAHGARSASLARFFGGSGGGSAGTREGGPEDPYNAVVPVRCCVEYIANSVSSLPFRVSTPDDQVIETGPLARLALRPNARQGIGEMWFLAIVGWLLFGRLHLRVTGDTVLGLQVEAINPLQMEPLLNGQELVAWTYQPTLGERVRLELDEVYTETALDPHNPFEPWRGVSPARAAGKAIAQYHQSDIANLTSLLNDVQPAGAVTTDRNLTEEQRRGLLWQLHAEHAGARNRRNVMLLEGGLGWEQMASTFAEMEFMEGRKMSAEAICASFGLKAILFFGQSGNGMNDDQAKAAAVAAHQSVIRPMARRLAEVFNCAVVDRLSRDRSMTMARGMAGDWRRKAMATGQTRSRAYQAARRTALAEDRVATAWFDDSGEAITTELWQAQATGAKVWFEMGVPLNDILRATDAPFEDHPHGEIPRIPAGLMDARELTFVGDTDPDGSDPLAGLGDDVQLPEAVPAPGATDDTDTPRAAAQRAAAERVLSEAQLAAIYRGLRAQAEPFARSFDGPYRRHLMQLRAEVRANLERVSPQVLAAAGDTAERSPVALHWAEVQADGSVIRRETVVALTLAQRNLIGQLLFDLRAAVDNRWQAVGRFVRGALQAGGEQSMSEAALAEGRDDADADPFVIANDGRAEAALRARQISLAGLAQSQAERLRATLAEGLANGETTADLGDRIGKQFGLEARRSQLVARQETGTAVESGRHVGRVQAGVPLKSWLWSRRETGRPNHAATEQATLAEPIPTEDMFVISGSGATCLHPRDTGIAEEDINCGCTTISRFAGDQIREARLMAGLAKRFADAPQTNPTPQGAPSA